TVIRDVLLLIGLLIVSWSIVHVLLYVSMERGFLSLKGSRGGRGVKEKSEGSIDVSAKVNNEVDEGTTTSSNVVTNTNGSANDTTHVTGVTPFAADGLVVSRSSDHMVDENVGLTPSNSTDNSNKEDVGNVPVWVKLHGVPMTAFSKDGLSAIATKIGTPLADVDLKDNIMVSMPKLVGEGFYTCNVHVEYEWKPPRCTCCKYFGDVQDECPKNKVSDVVSQKNNVSTNGNKKKDVEPTKEVSKSNLFDVLNLVENDVDLGINGGTSNLTNKKANSSESSFWNAESSSTSTTPIVEKIDRMKRLIIDGTATLVDDAGIPLKRVDSSSDHDSDDKVASVDNDMANFLASKDVDYGTNSLLEQWKESYGNGEYDYDPYDDDMYEGQDTPDKIQDICDNLDIKVRGREIVLNVASSGIASLLLDGGRTTHSRYAI
ncbi:RNA-directed DNA polymerase, eukaryota, reverse transcriptase zinc-binding domain protein, partial [Tanacetum coccineum]